MKANKLMQAMASCSARRNGGGRAAAKAVKRLRIGAAALAGAALCIALAGAARSQEFLGVDPLRQMGATTAKPLVYLFLDASKTMSNPMEIGDDQGNDRWYVNNTGGWRYVGDGPSFPYGPGGSDLCLETQFSDDVENPVVTAEWTHTSISSQYPDLWHIVTEPTCSPSAFRGSSSWYFGQDINAQGIPCNFEFIEPVMDCPDAGCSAPGISGNRCDKARTLCRRRVQGSIVSKTIDNIPLSATSVVLSFWSRAGTESGIKHDQKWVEFRNLTTGFPKTSTGLDWISVDLASPSTPTVLDVSGLWVRHVFDLSAEVAGGDDIQIRFRFDSRDYIQNRGFGWMVDDIRVAASDMECAAYAWYEPSRTSVVKNVLGGSVSVSALRNKDGCNFGNNKDGPDGTTPYKLAIDADENLTCAERTNFGPGFGLGETYLAPRLEDPDTLDLGKGFSTYDTLICVSDPHAAHAAGAGSTDNERGVAPDFYVTAGSNSSTFNTTFTVATGDATSAVVSYALTVDPVNSKLVKNCTKVELVGPNGTTTLKDMGALDASPYDVTLMYNDVAVAGEVSPPPSGPGDYHLRLTVESGCKAGTDVIIWAFISNANMRVEFRDPLAGGTGEHAPWNGTPCAYFTKTPKPTDTTIQTSTTDSPLDWIQASPRGIISAMSGAMDFGLMVGATNVGKAIGDTTYNDDRYDAATNSEGLTVTGGIAHLVPVNSDDEDTLGQAYNVARINAYLQAWGASTCVKKPGGVLPCSDSKAGITDVVHIGGLGVTDQPTFPIQNSDAAGDTLMNIITAMSDPNDPSYDPRSMCRKGYVIMLIDSFFTSGAACQGQMTATEGRLAGLAAQNMRTFVIQFGPDGRRYNANRLAYFGETDSEAKALDAGLWEDDEFLPPNAFATDGYDPVGCTSSNLDSDTHDYAYFATTRGELEKAFAAIFEAITAGDFVTAPPTVTPTAGSAGKEQYIGLLSSAQFPGWKGHLRAFDLRALDPTDPTAGLMWDAGGPTPGVPSSPPGLAGRTDDRSIWTSNLLTNQLLEITSGSAASLRAAVCPETPDPCDPGATLLPDDPSDPTIVTEDKCVQVNPAELVDFLLGFDGTNVPDGANTGRRRPWILGDVVNISPVLVQKALDFGLKTAPEKELSFNKVYSDRHPVVYMPANDGQLHAFDGTDGYEVWAYLPPTQVDTAAEMYCNFKREYDLLRFGISGTDGICVDPAACTQAELDAILVGDPSAVPPVPPLIKNPTGQKLFIADHIYGLAAAPRVGEIRLKINPSLADDEIFDGNSDGLRYRTWATALFMGEGAGGRNYYALDVTHPYGLSRSLTDPLTEDSFTSEPDACYGYGDDTCGHTQQDTGETNVPFRVLWRIGPDTKCPDGTNCFEGLGEAWSVFPVGLINDPTIIDTTSPTPPKRETFAVAFGSYHRIPETERCTQPCSGSETDNAYWLVRADTGEFMIASDGFPMPTNTDPYFEKAADREGDGTAASYDYKGECEGADLADGNCLPTTDTDRAKPKIPNSPLADLIMMETDLPAGIPPAFYPDGVVTHLFQADLHGRIWAADISNVGSFDWDVGTWTENWKQWKMFNPLKAPSAKVGVSDGDQPVFVANASGYWMDTDGETDAKKTPIGSQPIHYTPAIAHLTEERYVVAFSSGGWLESHPNVSGGRFAPHLVLFVIDSNLGDPGSCGESDCGDSIDNDGDGTVDEPARDPLTHGICQAWMVRLDNIPIVVPIISDPPPDPLPPDNPTLSALARVTGSPLIIIRRRKDDPATIDVDESTLPTRGTAIFTVYDPDKIEEVSGFCVGTSFAVMVDFEQANDFSDCTTGAAVTQVISIGVGFRTLTAGPTSPIVAVSGIGFDSISSLEKIEHKQWKAAGPEITVLSWQELSCDY